MLLDTHFMQAAMEEASLAYAAGEIPVGAVVVENGRIIARAHNRVQGAQAATAHAELIALQEAFIQCKAKYVPGCILYVTLEPCAMCAAACYWAQLGGLVFGATDPKRGYRLVSPGLIHPRTQLVTGILAEESTTLLRRFFAGLRTHAMK